MITIGNLVGDIPTTTITVRTYGAPSIDARGRTSQTSSDASVTAVVHPADGRTVERMGLDKRRGTISIYATAALWASDAVRNPSVQYGGRWYEVAAVEDYLDLGGIWMAHAQLLDAGAVEP